MNFKLSNLIDTYPKNDNLFFVSLLFLFTLLPPPPPRAQIALPRLKTFEIFLWESPLELKPLTP